MSKDESPRARGQRWAAPGGLTAELRTLRQRAVNRNLVELLGLAQLLREDHPQLAERCGLEAALASFRAAPSGVTQRVVGHPVFSVWLSVAKARVRALLGIVEEAEVPSEAEVVRHLGALQRFRVAVHLVASLDLDLALDGLEGRPLMFPGSGLGVRALPAGGRLELRVRALGPTAVALELEAGGRSWRLETDQPQALVEDARLEAPFVALPRVRGEGPGFELDVFEPLLLDHWLADVSFPGGILGGPLPEAELGRARTNLRGGLELVGTVAPALAEEIAGVMRVLLPVACPVPDRSISLSSVDRFGAAICSIDPPPMMAEVLVHEYRHNLLHALEQAEPPFAPGSPDEARFYSPWRDDPRPLSGILHAIFSFVPVAAVYASLAEGGMLRDGDARSARGRMLGYVLRSELAVAELRAHAVLTEFGAGLVEGLGAQLSPLASACRRLEGEAFATVRARVRDHAAARGHTGRS